MKHISFGILATLLAFAPSVAKAEQAYLSFSGGDGTPFTVTLHTPIRIDFTSAVPMFVALGFADVGHALESRGVNGLSLTMNGDPTLYAGFVDTSTGVAWNEFGVAGNNVSFAGDPGIFDFFISTPMLVSGAYYLAEYQAPTDVDLAAAIAAAEFLYGNGHPFTDMIPVPGSYFEIAPGSFSTNTGITVNSVPANGWYEVFAASAVTGVITDAVIATGPTSIPEPAAFAALVGLAGLGLAASRRRRA